MSVSVRLDLETKMFLWVADLDKIEELSHRWPAAKKKKRGAMRARRKLFLIPLETSLYLLFI
jgi:hypothetical protein